MRALRAWLQRARTLSRGATTATAAIEADDLSRAIADFQESEIRLQSAIAGSEYYSLVGYITVAWANLEVTLDNFAWMFALLQKDIIGRAMPISLKSKMAVFRKAHKEIPHLAELSDNANALLDRMIELREFRHQLIHGIATVSEEPATWTVTRYEYKGSSYSGVSKKLSIPELDDILRRIAALVLDMQRHFKQIVVIVHGEAKRLSLSPDRDM